MKYSLLLSAICLFFMAGTMSLHSMDHNAPSPAVEDDLNTQLFKAVMDNDPARVRHLLEQKPNLNSTDQDNRTALFHASAMGHDEIVKILLNAMTPLSIQIIDRYGDSALSIAVQNEHIPILPLLLKSQKMQEKDLLVLAAQKNRLRVMQWLTTKNPRPLTLANADFYPALEIAINNNHIEATTFLLKFGVHPTEKLLVSALSKNNLVLAQALLDAGAKIGEDIILGLFKDGNESLHLSTIEWLLDRGIDINFQNPSKETALIIAINKNRLEWVNFLLERNANTELTDRLDRTALIMACVYGYIEIVRSLVHAKASPLAIDRYGKNAIAIAGKNRLLPILKFFSQEGVVSDSELLSMAIDDYSLTEHLIEWLITKPSPINANDEGFNSALNFLTRNYKLNSNSKTMHSLLTYGVRPNDEHLYIALQNDESALVQTFLGTGMVVGEDTIVKAFAQLEKTAINLLLSAGNSINQTDTNGETALHQAINQDREIRIKLLLELGASTEVANKKGETPLILATKMGHYPLVRLLLLHGARPELVDYEQQTALAWAQRNNHKHIETLLLASQRPKPHPTNLSIEPKIASSFFKEVIKRMQALVMPKSLLNQEAKPLPRTLLSEETKGEEPFLTPTRFHFLAHQSAIEKKFGQGVFEHPIVQQCNKREYQAISQGKYVFYSAQPNDLSALKETMSVVFMFINRLQVNDETQNFTFTRCFKNASTAETIYDYLEQINGERDIKHSNNQILAANIPLFGNIGHDRSSTWHLFINNAFAEQTTSMQLDVERFFEEFFDAYGFDKNYIHKLILAGQPLQGAASLHQIIIPNQEMVDKVAMLAYQGYCSPWSPKITDKNGNELTDYNAEKRYYTKISPFLDGLANNTFSPINKLQARLLVGKDLLDPDGGVEIIEYTTLPKDVIRDFKQRILNITREFLLEWLERELRQDGMPASVAKDKIAEVFSVLGKNGVRPDVVPNELPHIHAAKEARREARVKALFPKKPTAKPATAWEQYAKQKAPLSRKSLQACFLNDCERDQHLNALIPKRSQDDGIIRVVTYNLHKWTNIYDQDSEEAILKTLTKIDADVLVLQEATPQDAKDVEEALNKLGYVYQTKHLTNLIASKMPFAEPPTARAYFVDENRGLKRGFINVQIELSNKKVLSIYGTHLDVTDESGDRRSAEISDLLEVLQGDSSNNILLLADWNTVVASDFNYKVAGQNAWELFNKNFTQRFPLQSNAMPLSALDLIEAEGFKNSFVRAAMSTGPSRQHLINLPRYTAWSGTVVDKIYLSRNFEMPVEGSYVYYSNASDHLPVVVDLGL